MQLKRVARALAWLAAGMLGAAPVAADVIFDGSTRPDGLRSELPAFRGNYFIEEFDGTRVGSNLFHSFERIDVESGMTARFRGASDLRNVIARVTGGGASRIDGALVSEIPGTNLFLLNRQGVIFGPGSHVDVTGGFFASSAPGLRFGAVELRGDAIDRSFESATGDATAFVFHSDRPSGAIQLDGARLRFAPVGGVFGFVGGEIEMRGGSVSARAGDIALAAVQGEGSVLLRSDEEVASGLRRIELDGVAAGGALRLLDGALLSSSGVEPAEVTPPGVFVSDPGSGTVVIRGGDLVVEDAAIEAIAAGAEAGGDIDIDLFGSARIERRLDPRNVGLFTARVVDPILPGIAPGGSVRLRASSLDLLGGAEISALTQDGSPGGRIDVDVDRVRLSGRGLQLSAIRSNTLASGDAGRIELRADELVMDDHGALVVESRGPGRAGDIDLELGSLRMSGDARIDSSIRSSGVGGDISVRVTGDARLSGASSAEEFTGITTLGQPESSAQAGTIFVAARNLRLADGARISAQSFGEGDAGSVTIEAAQAISLAGSEISTRSDQRDGGNLTLRAPELIELVDSRVSASVRSGTGGNVTIDPEFLILDHALIEARAEDGTGGNIDIIADFLLASPDSSISADSQLGVDGTVLIRSPSSDAIAGPAALSAAYRDPSIQLAERCAQSRSGSFVSAGIAAPPWTPDEPRFASYPGTGAIEAIAARGDLAQALVRLELGQGALDIAQLALRGRLRVQLGRDAQGWSDLDESLERANREGDSAALARVRLDRALLRAEAGELELALRELEGAPAPALRARLAIERAALLAETAPAQARASFAQAREALRGAEGADAIALQLRVARVGARMGAPARELAGLYVDAARQADARGDAAARSFAWSALAELYAREGRHAEAAELAERGLLAAQQARRPELEAFAEWQAGRAALGEGNDPAAERALRRAHATTQRLRDLSSLDSRSQRRFALAFPPAQIRTDLVDALLRRAERTEDPGARDALLREARDQLEDQGASELRDYFRDACAAPQVASNRALAGTAVVHPVLLEDRAELIVELPDGMASVRLPATGPQIARAAQELRIQIEDRVGFRFWRPAQQLSDWIVRPLERRIEGLGIETLVFAPLGALRGVPFAALHDRERGSFLIERFGVAITPGMRLMVAEPMSRPGAALLRGGLTRAVQGFPALNFVGPELDAIGGVFRGPELLDEQFVEPLLSRALEAADFPIVHLASHGEFGGALDQSFVLTFDGKLGVDELAALVRRDPQQERSPLELLTLSACQTAAGDEFSALGLAGVAVRAGARSALATLWYVDDASSGMLMAEFYRRLAEPGTSRARALQRAQLALLSTREHRHPAYWAPFLLIGSGL